VNFIVHVDIQVTIFILPLAIKDISENPWSTVVGGFLKDWQKG
jgi:hypothetical protein